MTRLAAIAFVLGTAISATASAQTSAGPTGPASFQLQDFGTIPRRVTTIRLLRMELIQEELKLTDAQKQASTPANFSERFQEKLQAARGVEDPEKRSAAMQAVQQEI